MHSVGLPDEIWLAILTHLDWPTLWRSIRATHSQLAIEAEKMVVAHLLPTLSMGTTFTLGSGSRHRWYDVRATITFSFRTMNRHNQRYARFEVVEVHPASFHDRALERWRAICARGVDTGLEWHVSDTLIMHKVQLKKLVNAEDGMLWCDWRELLTVWVREVAATQARLDTSEASAVRE